MLYLGFNTKTNMMRVVNMKCKDEIVEVIYIDYLDIFLNLVTQHFK